MSSMLIHEILVTATEHHRSGRLEQAASLYGQILAREPDNADALHLSGLIAYQRGSHPEAIRWISRAIERNPQEASFHFHLGVVLAAAGNLEDARASYGKAILNRPDYPEAHNNLGLVLGSLGLNEEAKKSLEAALNLRADFVDAILNLGTLLKNAGDLEKALACYQKALALDPKCAGACNNLGNLVLRWGKLDEAIEYYRRSLSLNPNAVDSNNNLGGALMRLGRHDDALSYFNRALSLMPAHAGTHLNKAWLLLLRGEFASGWKEYEWRLKIEEQGKTLRRLVDQHRPAWDGSALSGKSIFVYCEQGLGDTIQFVRYLPLLKNQGARVIFCCQKELVSLFASASGIDVLLAEPADGRVTEVFDCHIPLMSLPLFLDPNLSEMPVEVPYLSLESGPIHEWESSIKQAGLKVGLVWAGRPTNREDWRRSCRLADFSPLQNVSGATFYSLQKGPAASEALAPSPGMNLIDLSPSLQDFKDTAAAIMNLDLLIAVDTAVVHLAGALARPVWTVLPHFPDWRWMLGCEGSRWYPTMRLFRQSQEGDWRSVFERIATELRLIVPNRRINDEI